MQVNQGARQRLWLLIATGWSLLLLLGSATVPIITQNDSTGTTSTPGSASQSSTALHVLPRFTLLHADGPRAVAVAAIPLGFALLVAASLLLSGRHLQAGWRAAQTLSVLLAVAGVIGLITILVGGLALPSAAALLVACYVRRPAGRPDRQLPVAVR